MLRHFILRYEDTKSDSSEWHKKIKAKEPELIELLKQKTWIALDKARTLKRQIDSGIFADDVKTEIEKGKDGISIENEPFSPRPNQPVTLRARFRRPEYDTSAARSEFTCVWDFGPELGNERGWEVSHYFPPPDNKDKKELVKISFEGPDGEAVIGMDDKPIEVPKELEIREQSREWFGQRTKIEAIKLLVVLFITLLGLIAGAREQLAKLDIIAAMIAVFLMGFGADTIKNLITQRPE